VTYCRRAHAPRHSDERCRDRRHRRALVRELGGDGERQCFARSQAATRRWRLVHRPDQELYRRRESDHSARRRMMVERRYLSGFGNEHATEAVPGTLPEGQNAPQKPPRGLYTEQISGTPFTAPRGQNRRAWLYRIRPSVAHKPFQPMSSGLLRSAPFNEVSAPPNQLRWQPLPIPSKPTDFIDGLTTMAGNGDALTHTGVAIHIYAANRSMTERFFFNADGEMLIVPQQGRLLLRTEMGLLEAVPGEIAVIQRGIKFRVELLEDCGRGYV